VSIAKARQKKSASQVRDALSKALVDDSCPDNNGEYADEDLGAVIRKELFHCLHCMLLM
jgi:hypothetical protein